MKASRVAPLMLLSLLLSFMKAGALPSSGPAAHYCIQNCIQTTGSLTLGTPEVAGLTVRVPGVDTRRPTTPFLFAWGDGSVEESWFPAQHTYAQSGSYALRVTARYQDGASTSQTITIRVGGQPDWAFTRMVPRRVQVPAQPTAVTAPPGWRAPDMLCFSDGDLRGIPRQAVEYVLDVAHFIGMDLCNQRVRTNASQRQLVLQNRDRCGVAFWYCDPASMALHPTYFEGTVGFSSMFHELGHNLTLNSPQGYQLGGHTDGPMNAIVSETLAQMFQQVIGHEILTRLDHYGIPTAALPMVRASGETATNIARSAYARFLANGCPYTTYNDPATAQDETFDTFMTVAYVFTSLAQSGTDHLLITKRMMSLLQTFSEGDRVRFQDRNNEPFRATLLVAAASYGCNTDLRERFRRLNFPVDDAIYQELMARVH